MSDNLYGYAEDGNLQQCNRCPEKHPDWYMVDYQGDRMCHTCWEEAIAEEEGAGE